MPTYKADHNVFHFAASKGHLGIYPTPLVIEHFKDEISSYSYSKGTFRIKYTEPVPVELIKKMAIYSYQVNNRTKKD